MQGTKLPTYLLPVLGLILLALGACRVDIDHEIWISADESGRARISTSIVLPVVDDQMDIEESLGKDNALDELAARVRATEGAELTKLDKESSSINDEVTILYYMEFTFNNLQTLQKIICLEPDKGISHVKKGKERTLSIDPHQFSLQSADEYQEYLSFFDMNMSLKLHLPYKTKEVIPEYSGSKKQKSLEWEFILDEDWYADEQHVITIKY
ncbi:MAG: hypothetical protein CVU50_01000 [Candidatus Cloacimonetes bacterium HGW-Cloacimonetes-3]|jgi:hypothetical protein|nr:MAG: hypothetical protein CVU50_01000 [Candidatus Cloacimonetes bacterium HGW-Cloacimonetes-3]